MLPRTRITRNRMTSAAGPVVILGAEHHRLRDEREATFAPTTRVRATGSAMQFQNRGEQVGLPSRGVRELPGCKADSRRIVSHRTTLQRLGWAPRGNPDGSA